MEIWIVGSNFFDSFQDAPKGKIFFFLDFMSEQVNKIGDNIFDDILIANFLLILNDSLEAQSVRLD